MSTIVARGAYRHRTVNGTWSIDQVTNFAAFFIFGINPFVVCGIIIRYALTDEQRWIKTRRALAKYAAMAALHDFRVGDLPELLHQSGNTSLQTLTITHPAMVREAELAAQKLWHVYRSVRLPTGQTLVLRRPPCAKPVGHARCNLHRRPE